MFHVVTLSALWKRRNITRFFMFWHKYLSDTVATMGIKLDLMVAVSDQGDEDICKEHGIPYVWAPNKPLGKKWNKVCEAMPEVFPGYDAVCVMGSDDFISIGYLQSAVHLMRNGEEYINSKNATMMDAATGRLRKFKGPITIGGGRLVARHIIEACGNRPWADERNNALDASFDMSVRKYENERGHPIAFSLCDDGILFTIKTTTTQMWTFDYLADRVITLDLTKNEYDALLNEFKPLFDKFIFQ